MCVVIVQCLLASFLLTPLFKYFWILGTIFFNSLKPDILWLNHTQQKIIWSQSLTDYFIFSWLIHEKQQYKRETNQQINFFKTFPFFVKYTCISSLIFFQECKFFDNSILLISSLNLKEKISVQENCGCQRHCKVYSTLSINPEHVRVINHTRQSCPLHPLWL